MLYLYAFVSDSVSVPEMTGIDGRSAAGVPLGSVVAVVAEVDGALEPTEENVLAHARVVEALTASTDAVLPVRFGRGFRDLEELERAVATLAPDLAQRLGDVRGCVEIGLHVVAPPERPAAATSGGEYMRRRLRDLSRAEAVAEQIHAPLAARARAATRTRSVGATALLRASYLVPTDEVAGFRACVDEERRTHPDLSFACTGPWPPYSFAALEAEAAAA